MESVPTSLPQTSLASMTLSAPQSSLCSEPQASLGSKPEQLEHSLPVTAPANPVPAPPTEHCVPTLPQPPVPTSAPLLPSVSIFAHLSARQQTKPACSDCGEPSHFTWRLVGEKTQKQIAYFDWLDGTLMLVVRYGDKLPPKRSRKSVFGPCSVDHFAVDRFEFFSIHSFDATEEELDDEDRIWTIAHHLITRKFPAAMMKKDCPNTYSLSSLLYAITALIEPTKTFIKSMKYSMEKNFFPFSMENNLVTVGLQSLPLLQGFNFSVDFSSGLGSAPSTFQVVHTIGSVERAAIEKVAKGVRPGPTYLKDLLDRLELYLKEKERALPV